MGKASWNVNNAARSRERNYLGASANEEEEQEKGEQKENRNI